MRSGTRKRKSSKRLPTSAGASPDDYQMVIEWSEDDACYVTTLPAWQNVQTHGATLRSEDWENIHPRLATRYRVIAYDQRGHGKSGRAADYSLDALAGDLVHVLRDVVKAPAIVAVAARRDDRQSQTPRCPGKRQRIWPLPTGQMEKSRKTHGRAPRQNRAAQLAAAISRAKRSSRRHGIRSVRREAAGSGAGPTQRDRAPPPHGKPRRRVRQ